VTAGFTPIGFVLMLSCEQQQVLPVRADRIAIWPTGAARLEGAVVPPQYFERCGFTDAAPTDGVHYLTTPKEQIPNVRARADADDPFVTAQALHLHEIGQAGAMEVRAKATLAHRVGGLFTIVHCRHGDSRAAARRIDTPNDELRNADFQVRSDDWSIFPEHRPTGPRGHQFSRILAGHARET
jgi:hypothetical protein